MMKANQAESCEVADPAIKLFGSNIPLAAASKNACRQQNIHSACFYAENEQMEFTSNDLRSSSGSNYGSEDAIPVNRFKPIGSIIQDNLVTVPPPSLEKVQVTTESAQNSVVSEKTAKRPDKPIPCPRCESLDTKFCYFNNYNLNQPRHFCRKCQRYWTAGGTLRNVPIGAGRRKNKHSASHQKHAAACTDTARVRCDGGDMVAQRCTSTLSIIGATSSLGKQPILQVPSSDTCGSLSSDSPIYSPTKMTSLGQESPLCKSMAATTLTLCKYMSGKNGVPSEEASVKVEPSVEVEHEELESEVHAPSMVSGDAAAPFPVASVVESVDESVITQKINHGVGPGSGNQANLANLSTYNGPWQLGNITSWKIPSGGAGPEGEGAFGLVPLGPYHNGAPLGASWLSLPWHLMYPPAMWDAPPLAVPWGPAAAAAAAAAAMMQNSGLGNTTVRKHQLEGSPPDRCIWVPKTLRINDPVDAARSSIWATLGLCDGPASSSLRGAPAAAKAFQEGKPESGESSTTFRHTNPAAFSRSAAFSESS